MSKITALHTGQGRGKRVNIFLDGKFAFSLDTEVAALKGLKVEQVLSADDIEALNDSDRFQRCLNAALGYLNYRPRSESEIREKLRRRSFSSDTIEAVTTRLKEQKWVDDAAFAQFWNENRQTFSPRSRGLTKLELRQKGLADDIIDRIVDTVDDTESAYRAALSKARNLSRADYQGFRRRLGGYLRRRGFSYEVINHTVERLWDNHGT